MGYTGVNMERVKVNNRSAILKLLNDQGPMSRKDIADRLGLTAATLTTLCAELLEEHLLIETGEVLETNRAGRRKIMLDINYEYRYVLAVSIEISVTTLAVCDLRGEHCTEHQIVTDLNETPENFLKAVADAGKVLLWEAGITKEQLLGTGVTIPGQVDRMNGVSILANRIWDRPVAVRSILEQYLECPVLLDNNVRAFARAEILYGTGRNFKDLMFLKWGPGVGSTIVADSRIYEGRDFKSAEIGHVRIEKNGLPCRCGRRGCLETRVSSHAIIRKLQEICDPEKTPELSRFCGGKPECIAVRDLYRLACLDDPVMWEALDEIIAQIAQTTCGMITVLAPERVVLYGNIFTLPRFYQKFTACCRAYDPAYDENYIVLSELNPRTGYIGPLALVVQSLFYLD